MQNDRTDKTDNKHSKKHKYGKHKIKKNFKNYVIDKENKDQTNVCMRCEFKNFYHSRLNSLVTLSHYSNCYLFPHSLGFFFSFYGRGAEEDRPRRGRHLAWSSSISDFSFFHFSFFFFSHY